MQVTWSHRPADTSGDLDLLTLGNATYTFEPRISAHFAHPANWGLKITDLRPTDAGNYICQISTFPPRVRIVFLEIRGKFDIILCYNLELKCQQSDKNYIV